MPGFNFNSILDKLSTPEAQNIFNKSAIGMLTGGLGAGGLNYLTSDEKDQNKRLSNALNNGLLGAVLGGSAGGALGMLGANKAPEVPKVPVTGFNVGKGLFNLGDKNYLGGLVKPNALAWLGIRKGIPEFLASRKHKQVTDLFKKDISTPLWETLSNGDETTPTASKAMDNLSRIAGQYSSKGMFGLSNAAEQWIRKLRPSVEQLNIQGADKGLNNADIHRKIYDNISRIIPSQMLDSYMGHPFAKMLSLPNSAVTSLLDKAQSGSKLHDILSRLSKGTKHLTPLTVREFLDQSDSPTSGINQSVMRKLLSSRLPAGLGAATTYGLGSIGSSLINNSPTITNMMADDLTKQKIFERIQQYKNNGIGAK